VLPSRRLASSSTNYPDIISELLVYILSWVYTSRYIKLEDVTPIARQLSLGFVGIMILTSIRLVLRGVTRVRNIFIFIFLNFHAKVVRQALRVTSRNLGASLMLLILAQLMVSARPPIRTYFNLSLSGHLSPIDGRSDEIIFSSASETSRRRGCRKLIFDHPTI
jgi:hypothetical protein